MAKIIARLYVNDERNNERAVVELLSMPRISLHHRDRAEELIELAINSDGEAVAPDTRWLCNALVDAGVLSFSICHAD